MSLLPVSFIEKSDIPALKAMWTQAFGDPEELMDGFFSLLDGAGFGLVCRDGGRAVSMAYVLEGLSCGDRRCAYIYAVATLEEYRGRGLGAELMSACREKAMLRGSGVICTCPAEPSLYDWYAKVLDMAPVAYADERLFDKLSSTDLSVASLSAKEYGDLRERHFAGKPHVSFPAGFLAMEEMLCRVCGGGLCRVGGGAAACYPEDGVLVVRELLCEEAKYEAVVSALTSKFGCLSARVRVPGLAAPCIAAVPSSSLSGGIWWGLDLN